MGRKSLFVFFIITYVYIVLASVFFSFFDISVYRRLIVEDGFIEYGSSLLWFFSSLSLAIYYFKNYGLTIKKRSLYFLSMSILFFVFCFEEISWGQRIFSIETPEFLSKINVQNEITLHNIGHISIFSNLFFIGNIVFFYFLNSLKSKVSFLHENIDIILPSSNTIIIFTISLSVWLLIGIRFGTLGFHPYSFYAENYYNQMDDEIFEFLSAFSFFFYSFFDVLNKNKTRRIS